MSELSGPFQCEVLTQTLHGSLIIYFVNILFFYLQVTLNMI